MNQPKYYACPACGENVLAVADYLARGLKCPHCATGFMPEFIAAKRTPLRISPSLAFPIVGSAFVFCVCLIAGQPFASILLMPLMFFYFIPVLVAAGKRNFNAIALLNLLLGWTFIGWVVALVWAATKDSEAK